jgi:hypothetical protein
MEYPGLIASGAVFDRLSYRRWKIVCLDKHLIKSTDIITGDSP